MRRSTLLALVIGGTLVFAATVFLGYESSPWWFLVVAVDYPATLYLSAKLGRMDGGG